MIKHLLLVLSLSAFAMPNLYAEEAADAETTKGDAPVETPAEEAPAEE